ncbi:TIGR02569 family protein [Streptomyces sp. LHD-70]|uniref:TIGR02569 family protein n=1 Tax=Streptomyces sp. LHD-70 TaxID=3072140 RepID=UPI00280DFEAD|nr:TIGR02569 family protein [Streptomyces sp. LHD-70]MDQ8705597.1 TIGR02569 family protein [Streptomyces sp. LHD-70]
MFAIRPNKPNSANNVTSISTLPRQEPPGLPVLAAFGVTEGEARPLPGGQGGTWCADGIVLKRTGLRTETAWRAHTLNALPETDEFRVAPPVRSMDGTWTAGGWEAWRLVPGTADERRVDDVLRVGRAFHAALAELPRPAFLDERDDPWSRADRFSWGYAAGSAEARAAEEAVPAREFDLVAPLLAARTPLPEGASQVVHGDLLGNVLFADADGLPPAIIDWPAYWRPPGWASAVAAVDALCWHGADPGVLDRWAHVPRWRQLLVRAVLFRIATHERLDPDLAAAYRPVADLVLDGHWPQATESRTAQRRSPRAEPRGERRPEPTGLRAVRAPEPEPEPERTHAEPEPLREPEVQPQTPTQPQPQPQPQRAEPQQEMLDVCAPLPEEQQEPAPEPSTGPHAEPSTGPHAEASAEPSTEQRTGPLDSSPS